MPSLSMVEKQRLHREQELKLTKQDALFRFEVLKRELMGYGLSDFPGGGQTEITRQDGQPAHREDASPPPGRPAGRPARQPSLRIGTLSINQSSESAAGGCVSRLKWASRWRGSHSGSECESARKLLNSPIAASPTAMQVLSCLNADLAKARELAAGYQAQLKGKN